MFKVSVSLQTPCHGALRLAEKLDGKQTHQNDFSSRIEQIFEFSEASKAEKFADSVRYFPEVFSANHISSDENTYLCPIHHAIAESRLCPCGRVTKWECKSACEIAERAA